VSYFDQIVSDDANRNGSSMISNRLQGSKARQESLQSLVAKFHQENVEKIKLSIKDDGCDFLAVESSNGFKEWWKNAKEFNDNIKKINFILSELSHSFIAEDRNSSDYCKYCNSNYGNYEKFGYSKR
jgi:hypothetical protein